MAFCPRLRSWLRREVLPSMAVGLVRPALGHPRRKAGRKQLRIDPVHDRPQPIGARDAVVKLTETPQERQVSRPPIDDIVIVIAAGNRAAYHQE